MPNYRPSASDAGRSDLKARSTRATSNTSCATVAGSMPTVGTTAMSALSVYAQLQAIRIGCRKVRSEGAFHACDIEYELRDCSWVHANGRDYCDECAQRLCPTTGHPHRMPEGQI